MNYYPYNIYFFNMILPVPRKGIGYLYYRGTIKEVSLLDPPVFLGATVGHSSIYFNCNYCDYVGMTNIKRIKGFTYYLFGITTLGLGLCFTLGTDTEHYCPQCDTHLAYAKLM